MPRSLRIDLAVLLGGSIVLSVVAEALEIDLRIARALYDPATGLAALAETLSEYSFPIACILLGLTIVPPLRRRFPLAARSGAVFAVTLVVGVLALIINLKTELDRPRPVQIQEFGGELTYQPPFGSDPACSGCKSFPSSAAGFGFLMATPFFVLRRAYPNGARSLLAAGLAWGAFIGYGRVVAGAHWATDILWSATIVLLVATIVSHLDLAWRSASAQGPGERPISSAPPRCS